VFVFCRKKKAQAFPEGSGFVFAIHFIGQEQCVKNFLSLTLINLFIRDHVELKRETVRAFDKFDILLRVQVDFGLRYSRMFFEQVKNFWPLNIFDFVLMAIRVKRVTKNCVFLGFNAKIIYLVFFI
jgi:hypothetical protein